MIDTDKLTIGEVKSLARLLNLHTNDPVQVPFEIGKSYFIRTVTYHLTGCLVAIYPEFLVLKQAAWIADSGRFTQAIRDGVLSEVEPVGEAYVSIASITDAFPWVHALPETQK